MSENTCASGEGKALPFNKQLALCEKSFLDRQKWRWRANTDKRMNAAAKLILDALVMHINCKYEECFPSQELLCSETAMSENSVRSALKTLRDCGWITWRRATRPGSRTFFVYRMIWDANPEIPAVGEIYQGPANPSEIASSEDIERAADPSIVEAQIPQKLSPNSQREITNSSLSSASPTRESASRGKSHSPSAEKKPPEKYSTRWWQDRVWLETGEAFKARFYPTISKAAFKQRLGGVIKQQQNDLPGVDRAMLDTLKAEPGGDAWEYVIGILRGHGAKGRPADELDRGYRPRAPIDDCII